jgi:autotransporter translocation and assembly factor TamB
MKKFFLIAVPVLLVLCVACVAVVYFAWPTINSKILELQGQLTITPTLGASLPGTTTNPSQDDTTTTTSDVCNMLTLDIAKQILGTDTKLASQNSGNCTYSSISEDMSSFGVLTMVVTKMTGGTAKVQFDQARATVYENKTETVSGLKADEAYYATGLMQLSILKGDSWIIISGTSDKFADEKELAIATAKLVLK